ncbi:hypothetical protein KKG63_00330 [Patescibacteria group bacterium]|nr:hypothetical protein [Patescibacteria group bacterium]
MLGKKKPSLFTVDNAKMDGSPVYGDTRPAHNHTDSDTVAYGSSAFHGYADNDV